MAIKTQLRLSQVTGSFSATGNGKSIITSEPASAIADISVADLSGSLSHMASAIGRIHGRSAGEAFNNAEGTFYVDIVPNADGSLDLGSASAEFAEAHVNAIKSATTLDVDSTGKLSLDGAGGIDIGVAADVAIDIDASTLDIDAAGALTIDSATSIAIGTTADKPIDIDATTLTIDTSSTFSIDGVGSSNVTTDSGNLAITTTTSGQVDISAAGSVDIDAQNDVTVNAGGDGTGKVVLSGSNGADSVHVQSALTVVGDAIFSGNLTVNGEQFKVDGETVVVDDSLMELATVGKAAPSSDTTSKDKGFLLHHHNGSAASLNFMGFDSTNASGKFTFKTGVTDDGDGSISGGSVATVLANIEGSSTLSVVTDSTANTAFPVVFHDEANALLDSQFVEINPNAKKLQFIGGDAADIASLSVDANAALTIQTVDAAAAAADINLVADGAVLIDSAGDINLDADGADIFFKDAGTIFGSISMLTSPSDMLVLSSSAGKTVALMANNDEIMLSNNDGQVALTLNLATGNTIKMLDSENQERIFIESSSGNDQVFISGSFMIDNGGGQAHIKFNEENANGNNFCTLRAAESLADSNTVFELPANNGVNGYLLQTNGSGVTSWVAAGAANATKVVQSITSGDLSAGSAASGATGLSTFDSRAITDVTAPNVLDVFVNGQLLASSSVAYASISGTSAGDYAFSGVAAASDLKFTFDLETDDVVTVVIRA